MSGFEWLNPPPRWSGDAGALELETGANTDFWRETFYGFVRDSGHAWLRPVEGDFSLSVRFRGAYETLYDQAGLMLRRDDGTWIKTGIEYTDGAMHFSVVVTGPRSDWSVIPLDAGPDTEVAARLTRHGDAVRVQYALAGGPWRWRGSRRSRTAPPAPASWPARRSAAAFAPGSRGWRSARRSRARSTTEATFPLPAVWPRSAP